RRQDFVQVPGKVIRLKMVGGDVNTDIDPDTLLLPALYLQQRVSQHPFTNLNIQRVMLNGGQEVARREQPFPGMLPPDQRFNAQNLSSPEINLGLEIKPELILVEPPADVLQ